MPGFQPHIRGIALSSLLSNGDKTDKGEKNHRKFKKSTFQISKLALKFTLMILCTQLILFKRDLPGIVSVLSVDGIVRL